MLVCAGQFVTDTTGERCVLPLAPQEVEPTADSDLTCFLFNSHPESRIEYDTHPEGENYKHR